MITWIRTSGREITTGDSQGCLALAKAQGWVRKEAAEVAEIKPKRKRRTRAQMEAARGKL